MDVGARQLRRHRCACRLLVLPSARIGSFQFHFDVNAVATGRVVEHIRPFFIQLFPALTRIACA